MSWLRTLLRDWLGVDQVDRRVDGLENVAYLQGRSLGAIRQDIVGIRFDIGERGKALYLGRDDRPYTADERRAAVENVIGPDPNREPAP